MLESLALTGRSCLRPSACGCHPLQQRLQRACGAAGRHAEQRWMSAVGWDQRGEGPVQTAARNKSKRLQYKLHVLMQLSLPARRPAAHSSSTRANLILCGDLHRTAEMVDYHIVKAIFTVNIADTLCCRGQRENTAWRTKPGREGPQMATYEASEHAIALIHVIQTCRRV